MPVVIGNLGSPEIAEASGIVASQAHPGVYYVHNDSGDTGRVFAIDAAGTLLATYELTGAPAIDWEDISLGPCAGGTCVYVADIGDNGQSRANVTVHRFPEPASIGSGTQAVAYETATFTYDQGAFDAEAFVVDPTTGDVAVVTKAIGDARVFVGSLTFGGATTLTQDGSISFPGIFDVATAADVRADGSVLVRTYFALYRFVASPGSTLAQTLAQSPCTVPAALEAQGEAVAFTADGHGYVTVSEGSGAALNASTCMQ